jgi:pentatricopeptide repeat protein
LLLQLFENMLEDGVAADPPLYCNYINAAGRAGNLGLARYLYQHMMLSLNLAAGSSSSNNSSPASSMATSSSKEEEKEHLQDTLQQQQQQQQRQQNQQQQNQQQQQQQQQRRQQNQQQLLASSGSSATTAVAPNMLTMVNALLFAHAQLGAFQSALSVYQQELVGRGLQPDAYTCTALLTAAARVSNLQLSWDDVQQIVRLVRRYDIQLTTQLGTALINAYRRVRVWQRPQQQQQQQQQQEAGSSSNSNMAQLQQKHKGRRGRRGPAAASAAAAVDASQTEEEAAAAAAEAAAQQAAQQEQDQEQQELQLLAAAGASPLRGVRPVVAASLHAARSVLRNLQDSKLATSNSYVMMLCFLLEQGQFGAFKQLYAAMQRQDVQPDDQGWERLLIAAGECGMQDTVQQMMQQAESSPGFADAGVSNFDGQVQQLFEEEQAQQQHQQQLRRMREMQQAGAALLQQQQQAPRERTAR